MRALYLLLPVFLAGCGQGAKDGGGAGGAGREEKAAVIGTVEVGVLNHLYQTNAAAAEEKYTNRRMTCTGYVYGVVKSGDGFVVHFVYPHGESRIGTRARFPASQSSNLAKLEKYSPVQFKALCVGLNRTESPAGADLVECEVVPLADPAKKD